MSRLLTAEDIAERWQVSTDHVYRLARAGRLPVVELGRYKRFRVEAIEAFEVDGGTGQYDDARAGAQRSKKPLQLAAQSGFSGTGREAGRR